MELENCTLGLSTQQFAPIKESSKTYISNEAICNIAIIWKLKQVGYHQESLQVTLLMNEFIVSKLTSCPRIAGDALM